MRSMRRISRDVKRLCAISCQRRHRAIHFPRHFRLLVQNDGPTARYSRRLATTAISKATEAWPESGNGVQSSLVRPNTRTASETVFTQKPGFFGRWEWLLSDSDRLSIETDFKREDRAKRRRKPLFVDHLDNQDDFELWSCLLNYLQRMRGDSGIWELWYAMWGRKALYSVNSISAKVFWRTISEAAVRSNNAKFLESIWVYAEWMLQIHGSEWPAFYTTIISHLLREHRHEEALQWHLRLSPNFYPGSREFVNLIIRFSTDRVLNASATLQFLYVSSPERRLYDLIVPYLYDRGLWNAALAWRNTCLNMNDEPILHAPNRPFLRYLQGFWGNVGHYHPLSEKECHALERHDSPETAEQQVELSREFMNRVHGATFGFSAKTYNDRLGARWFASSWVSLDTAISVISALGLEEIGPLSVQSIALREDKPKRILARLAQLSELGIRIPKSNYVKAIQYLAWIGEHRLLQDFLHCDLHPDVFDNAQLQTRLLEASVASADWRTYQILVGARLVTSEIITRNAANALLQTYLLQGNHNGICRVLDDMQTQKVSLHAELSDIIFKTILENVPEHVTTNMPRDFYPYLSICRRLSLMEVPIPVICWRRILFALGRHGRLDELHDLCIYLVDYYQKRESVRPGFIPLHKFDAPKSMMDPAENVHNLIGLYVPAETPSWMPMHPLAQLFDDKLRAGMIRWAFRKMQFRSQDVPLINLEQNHFHVARAISFVRHLRDRGLHQHPVALKQQMQKWIILRLAELYGEVEPTKRSHYAARLSNVLNLSQLKSLCDAAWGEELLPNIEDLKARIAKADNNRKKEAQRWYRVQQLKPDKDNKLRYVYA